jgi:uncharacterized repeat protein (TIGR03833 family)
MMGIGPWAGVSINAAPTAAAWRAGRWFSKDIRPGVRVNITQKHDQHSGRLTGGIVKDVLTKSAYRPHGIKVRLDTGEVGRVQEIVEPSHEAAERGRPDTLPRSAPEATRG